MTTTYAIIGAAGFVAPRHLKAIADTGGQVVGACDPHDSVGILDRYFPHAEFFTEEAAFDRWLRKGVPDWLVVCSPNYLHSEHVRKGLQAGCNVLCEKPFALNPENLDELQQLQDESALDLKVRSVLQMRYLIPQELRDHCASGEHSVRVKYVTPRGAWYHRSWKGNEAKSGGLITNIGIHLFDTLIELFGPVEKTVSVHRKSESRVNGVLKLERAKVHWDLSIATDDTACRVFTIDEQDYAFGKSDFENAHTKVYEEILAGRGFGISDVRPAVELCWHLRDPE